MVRYKVVIFSAASLVGGFGMGDALNPDLGIISFIIISGFFWLSIILFICANSLNDTLKGFRAPEKEAKPWSHINSGSRSTIITGDRNTIKLGEDATG